MRKRETANVMFGAVQKRINLVDFEKCSKRQNNPFDLVAKPSEV